MTNPEQSTGPAHPARAAGYALLGVAVIALVVGLISLFIGGPDDDPPAAQPTTSDAPSGTASAPGDPTSSAAPSSPNATDPTTPAPTTTGNPSGTSATGIPQPPVTTEPKPPVRVYNNSTTVGLAARASDDVERAGWDVAETGNYSQGLIPTTTVYYRPGTDEEASARQLGLVLNAEVKPRFDGIQSAKPGIIVIVTNDYRGPAAKAAS